MGSQALYKIGQQLQKKVEAPAKYPSAITIKDILPGTEVRYDSNPLGATNGQHKEPMDPSGTGPNNYFADNGETYTEDFLLEYYINEMPPKNC